MTSVSSEWFSKLLKSNFIDSVFRVPRFAEGSLSADFLGLPAAGDFLGLFPDRRDTLLARSDEFLPSESVNSIIVV